MTYKNINNEFSLVNEMGDIYNVSVDGYGALVTKEIIDLTRSNTFDKDGISDSIQSITQNSFNNLLQTQINICNMRRFDSLSEELKPYKRVYGITTLDEMCYYPINAHFILTEKRKEFNNKGYYRDLSIEEIVADDKVFHYIPKVFINGIIIDKFKIRCFEDKTIIIFKYNESFTDEFYQEMIRNNYKITTILFPKTNNIINKKFNVLTFRNKAIDILYECRYSSRSQEQIFTLTPQTEYIQIPLREYPIPTEHILPFAKVNNVYKFLHDVKFEYHYPDIYKPINLPTDVEVEFMVFYKRGIVSTHFINDLDLYYKHKEVLSLYNNGEIPEYIKTYTPKYVTYSIPDYRSSENFGEVDLYKLRKLQEYADNNSRHLYDYLEKTVNSNVYYLDVRNIDLSSRYRLDNFKEVENQFSQLVFDKPKYVFIFAKDSLIIPKSYRIFIDGIHHVCEYIYTEGEYDIIYLDADRIKDTSLIEIEMYQNIDVEYPMIFRNTNEEFTVNLGIYTSPIYANDIYFIDEKGDMIDKSNFRMYMNGSEYPISFVSNTILNGKDFNIACREESLMNRNISIKIVKGINTYKHSGAEFKNKSISTKNIKFYHSDSVCVYINDRFIPHHTLQINHTTKNNSESTITLPYQPKDTDVIVIQNIPNKIKTVHFNSTLNNSNGFINTFDILDKPLSLSWYDIFVNGVKINRNQIDIITPTKAILKGIKSSKNISIVQYNRDRECVVLKKETISDVIWDNEEDIRDYYLKELTESEPSII